jgi:chloride channel, nucleotide-sensitive, 1A
VRSNHLFLIYTSVPSLTASWPVTVEPIFEALSTCASLHPDSQQSDGDDDDDAFMDPDTTEFEVFTGDGDEELSEVGRVRSAPVNDNRYQPY